MKETRETTCAHRRFSRRKPRVLGIPRPEDPPEQKYKMFIVLNSVGQPMRLRIRMYNVKLYAFRFFRRA